MIKLTDTGKFCVTVRHYLSHEELNQLHELSKAMTAEAKAQGIPLNSPWDPESIIYVFGSMGWKHEHQQRVSLQKSNP